ncbi:hypothetical protein MAHJHV54_47910 [Mycobacterium avium subsp. hominissuis]
MARSGGAHRRHRAVRQPSRFRKGLTDGSMAAMGTARAGHHNPLPTPSTSPGAVTAVCGDVLGVGRGL